MERLILTSDYTNLFEDLHNHVKRSAEKLGSTGAALFIIHNDKVVTESYFGKQSSAKDASDVKEDTQFHIASVRKAYIGFAAAYSIYNGHFSIDDPIRRFAEEPHLSAYEGIKICHLLTHNTNVALLVIPDENVVAVRMFNRYGSSEGYDYLSDIRSFGDTVYNCSIKTRITH